MLIPSGACIGVLSVRHEHGHADGEEAGEEDEEDLNPFDLTSAGSSDEVDDDDDAADRTRGGLANVASLEGMSQCFHSSFTGRHCTELVLRSVQSPSNLSKNAM